MFCYRVYERILHSDRPLALLPTVAPEAPPDLAITHEAALPVPASVQSDGPTQYALLPDATLYLAYDEVGAFAIQAHRVAVAPAPSAAPALLQRFLIGPVLGLALRMQGRLILHSNVVLIHDQACLLLGHSGAGKSTLTAAFHHAGYAILSDDVGAVHWFENRPWATPGPQHIKLWPGVVRYFDADPASLPLVQPGTDKRLQPTMDAVSAAPVAACYVLAPGAVLSREKLSPTAAFLALLEHAHMPRSLPITGHQAAHFTQSTRLAQQIPTYALTRTEDLAALPALMEAVISACPPG